MWLQRWLGDLYVNLWVKFRYDTADFEEIRNVMSIPENKLRVALSLLKKHKALIEFEKVSRKIHYRITPPEVFFLLQSGMILNTDKIPPKYFQLITRLLNMLLLELDLLGFSVYGSVARGTAKLTSDVDLFLVSEGFQKILSHRIDSLIKLEKKVEDEILWLSNMGIYTHVSWIPLTPNEVKKFPPILLDICEDGIILYEKNRFLNRLFSVVKGRLAELGAVRVYVKNGWYWDLKPSLKYGEDLKIELPTIS